MAMLWPQTASLPEAIKALVPLAAKPAAEPAPNLIVIAPAKAKPASTPRRTKPVRREAPAAISPSFEQPAPMLLAAVPPLGLEPPAQSVFAPSTSKGPDRWSASGWLVARGGSGTGTAPGGQLSGSQAGIRIAYLLAPRQRISAFARVTAPLAGKGSETALGIEWQPWQAPIRLAIEQRVSLDGGSGGIGAGVTAGLYRETHGLRLEGYSQAGAIARSRIEPYADGAIRVTRPIAPSVALGAGAWGGAQRDAQRLDIGPSASLAIGKLHVSLDWRQRIAGRARPGSGLAVTLGGDF